MPIYQAPPGFDRRSMHGWYEKREIIQVDGKPVEHITKFDPGTGNYEQVRVPLPPKREIIYSDPPEPPKEKPGFFSKMLSETKRKLKYIGNKIVDFVTPKPKEPWEEEFEESSEFDFDKYTEKGEFDFDKYTEKGEFDFILPKPLKSNKNALVKFIRFVITDVLTIPGKIAVKIGEKFTKYVKTLPMPTQKILIGAVATLSGMGTLVAVSLILNIVDFKNVSSGIDSPPFQIEASSSGKEASSSKIPSNDYKDRGTEQPLNESMFLYNNSKGNVYESRYINLALDTKFTKIAILEFVYVKDEHNGKWKSEEDKDSQDDECKLIGKYFYNGKYLYIDVNKYTPCGHFNGEGMEIIFEVINPDSEDAEQTKVKLISDSIHFLEKDTILDHKWS